MNWTFIVANEIHYHYWFVIPDDISFYIDIYKLLQQKKTNINIQTDSVLLFFFFFVLFDGSNQNPKKRVNTLR